MGGGKSLKNYLQGFIECVSTKRVELGIRGCELREYGGGNGVREENFLNRKD